MTAKSHTRKLLYIISYKMNILTKHFDKEQQITYVEFLLPDGRYFYYEFNNNHKIEDKIIWQI